MKEMNEEEFSDFLFSLDNLVERAMRGKYRGRVVKQWGNGSRFGPDTIYERDFVYGEFCIELDE